METQQTKTEELTQKSNQLLKELQSLQMQHHSIQNDLQLTIQSLEKNLAKERKIKTIAEEECLQKNNVSKLKICFIILLLT